MSNFLWGLNETLKNVNLKCINFDVCTRYKLLNTCYYRLKYVEVFIYE